MKHRLFKAACLLAFICSLQISAQAQDKWDAKLKMPYSGDQILLLRQFTHDAYAESDSRSYFEFYRLNLKPLEKYPLLDCSHLIPGLTNHISEQISQTFESEFKVTVAESLCADFNQNGRTAIFLKVSNAFYFSKHHYGMFLYEQNGEQILNLLGEEPAHILGHKMVLREQNTASASPTLMGISYAPGLDSRTVYISPLAFSSTENVYEAGKLTYTDTEQIYQTKNKKLGDPEFNFSQVNAQELVLNRKGSLVGFMHREGVHPSGWVVDFLKVVETQTGRAEQIYLGDPNKGLHRALKQKFPKYMQTPGFASLEPEILGFNQDNLIFKLNLSGSCHDAAISSLCNGGMGTDHEQIEKMFPRRFAGYWSYHYRTGALKLISWDSKAPINVEHTGYDVEFR